MRMTLASFVFRDKNNEYRADYYPIGKSEYKVAVIVNGFCTTEVSVTGRQSLGKFNAKQLITKYKDHGKEENTGSPPAE